MDSGGYLTCIPLIAAASPGKVDGEAAEEVEEGPGQDDDVVNVEKDDDHLGGVADAWGGGGAERGWRQCTDFPYTTQPCLGQRSRATPSVLKHEGLGPGSWLPPLPPQQQERASCSHSPAHGGRRGLFSLPPAALPRLPGHCHLYQVLKVY